MSHNTLQNYYNVIYNMVHQFQFATITEIENMIPFELHVYTSIITNEARRKSDQMKVQHSLERNQL